MFGIRNKSYPLPDFLEFNKEKIPLTLKSENPTAIAMIDDSNPEHLKVLRQRLVNVEYAYQGMVLRSTDKTDDIDTVLHCQYVGYIPDRELSNVLEPVNCLGIKVKYFAPRNPTLVDMFVSAVCDPVNYDLYPYT